MAGTYTTNILLYKPAVDERDWGLVVNANFTTLDTLAGAGFIIQTANAKAPNAQILGSLATGLLKNTTTTGVLSVATQGTDYYKPGGTDVAVVDGGTGLSAWTLDGILYASGTTTLGQITKVNSAVLVTNVSGTPSLATDLPTAVTIGSAYIYRAGGTDVPVADGGTGGGVASITLFNNITGLSAAGTTGTTSTNLVFSTSPTITSATLVTPALGTPTSGTLTNCSGLPISGLVASTSTALGVGTIELGHATDCTIARSGSGAITVEGVQVILSGAALGTPSSGTLTNCTGLPVAGITASTSTALGVGSIELGHATDTTISKSSSGVIAVEGVVIPSISSTNTLTNKFITPQVQSVADAGGTFTPVSLTNDMCVATALSQATTIAAPSGSPVQGERLVIRLKDNGTARALTWNAIYRASSDLALPTTTVLSKTIYCGFFYNSTDTKWDLVAKLDNF